MRPYERGVLTKEDVHSLKAGGRDLPCLKIAKQAFHGLGGYALPYAFSASAHEPTAKG